MERQEALRKVRKPWYDALGRALQDGKLDSRTSNCLSNVGGLFLDFDKPVPKSIDEVKANLRKYVLAGGMNPKKAEHPRNFGKKSYVVMMKWLGLDVATPTPLYECPCCHAALKMVRKEHKLVPA